LLAVAIRYMRLAVANQP